ncbi:hypothetical protein AOQ84DRAFT_227583 [Glonium stellatum]|uniref:Uncharacterized protein n=1 Tax=Glonium stellatum TaxID=574774 RepID=A0A8E2F8H1_9PEZI|nr:hypothetical protein AOQ84DRAFT_227583 [Glonium stellatum]
MSGFDKDNAIMDGITFSPTLPPKLGFEADSEADSETDPEPGLNTLIGSPNLTTDVATWERKTRRVASMLHVLLANTTALGPAHTLLIAGKELENIKAKRMEAEAVGHFCLVGRLQVMEWRLGRLIKAQRLLDHIMKLTEGYIMKAELSLSAMAEAGQSMEECEVRG